ncbi:MAG: chlorophyll A-B binding protein [Moorea sp. SIO2B7]|nr:chlorophyll A-B binding protein [Moorena sp. SIO2B7]
MENDTRNGFKFGFTDSAESWNGRLAMLGFVIALGIELVSGQGVLHFLGLI